MIFYNFLAQPIDNLGGVVKGHVVYYPNPLFPERRMSDLGQVYRV